MFWRLVGDFGFFVCFIGFMIKSKCYELGFFFSFFKDEFFSDEDVDLGVFIIDSFFDVDMNKVFVGKFEKSGINYILMLLFD